MTTSEQCPPFQRTLFLEGRPASKPASAPPSAAIEPDFLSGPTCYVRGSTPELNGLSWSSRPETVLGKPQVSEHLSRAGYHVARFVFGAQDIGAPYPRRRVYLIACTSLSRLEIAWAAGPQAIERAKRAAVARGDWHPDSIPAFDLDTWRSEDVLERREAIEALGDSNPPAMAEVIGHMICAAEPSIPRALSDTSHDRGAQ